MSNQTPGERREIRLIALMGVPSMAPDPGVLRDALAGEQRRLRLGAIPAPDTRIACHERTWVNRLIGDQQEGVTTKYTYTAQQFYRADSPLLPSGLIGPVQVVRTVSK